MVQMKDTVTINAPIDAVFAYVTDFRNTAKWHKNMKKVGFKTNDAPRVGSRYDWVESFAGKALDLGGEITSWDPPYSFAWQATDPPFEVSGGWTFATEGPNTTVTRYSDSELSGFMKVMSAVMVPLAKRQVRQELSELKRLIECSVG